MRLTLWVASLFLVIILSGTFLFIKFNPPLEIGTIISSDDKKITLIDIGNKGFSKIKLTNVLVNTNETPIVVKLQVSNLIDGFTLTDDSESKDAKDSTFKDFDEVKINIGTSPVTDFKKTEQGTASRKDIIYGINIFNNQAITHVEITYKYLGLTFNDTVKIK